MAYDDKDTLDKLREINQHIADNPKPEIVDAVIEEEDKPSGGLYIAMILLASCLSCVGLIMGIVYLTKPNKNYRQLGIVTLVISLVILISGFLFIFAMVLFANMAF
ncbi:MAG: hypothetical protein FWD03_04005 [Defluviitaleaceae bacterium]|nr:hypothetical protein [Defluviitaleaceae bacterium]